jgi:hypothetical protein
VLKRAKLGRRQSSNNAGRSALQRATTNYAIPRSLRETVCRTYYRESNTAAIFGNQK